MKENIERRSLVQRVFPPISKEEDAKTFSSERAKRGAKIGATIGLAVPLVVVVVRSFTTNTELAEIDLSTKATILRQLLYAGFGAAVDGFKPTSRLLRFTYEPQIKIAKEIAGEIKKLRNKQKPSGDNTSGDNTSDVI